VVEHRDHMLVFQQERHLIESGDQWRRVRAGRKAFERLVADVLERAHPAGDRRLALLALLGMVNHTAQWYRPRGELSPSRSPMATSRSCSAPAERGDLPRVEDPSGPARV